MENCICRVCESNANLINLTNNTEDIIEKLTNLANVSYSLDDNLPKFICRKCAQDLEFSIQFKRKCEETDQKLRYASTLWIKSEFSDVVEYGTATYSRNSIKVENQIVDATQYIFASANYENNDDCTDDFFDNSETLCKTDIDTNSENDEKIIANSNEANSNFKEMLQKTFECFICQRVCKMRRSLKMHFRKMHEDNEYSKNREIRNKRTFECYVCKKVYGKNNSLRSHFRNSHIDRKPPERVQCTMCSVTCISKANLRRHVRNIHEGIKPYACTYCGRSFAQKSVLDEHTFTHKDEKTVQCHLCPHKTKTVIKLKFHLKTHFKDKFSQNKTPKPNKNKPKKAASSLFTCEYCGKQSSSLTSHVIHIRTHTGEKPFHCDVCDKRFAQKVLLDMHARIHTGELPYECKTCGRKFRQHGQLTGHMLTHTGDKPHICKFCDKSFALRGNLTVHLRLHTGERPYHCTSCDFKVHSVNGLKRHKKLKHP